MVGSSINTRALAAASPPPPPACTPLPLSVSSTVETALLACEVLALCSSAAFSSSIARWCCRSLRYWLPPCAEPSATIVMCGTAGPFDAAEPCILACP